MRAGTVWIVMAGMFLFSGCKGCKKESGEQPPAAPVAGEPQKPAAPQVDAVAEPAETASPDAEAEEPKPIVKHTIIETPDAERPNSGEAEGYKTKVRHTTIVTPNTKKARERDDEATPAHIQVIKLKATDPPPKRIRRKKRNK
jgi:hypothetical protein